MAIKKKSLIGAATTTDKEADATSGARTEAKPAATRKLAVAKLATAKLSTAKLTTLKRLS
jgi:hypothetical protein